MLESGGSWADADICPACDPRNDRKPESVMIDRARNSADHLHTITHRPLCHSQPGDTGLHDCPNGGYRLAKPANEITMLEILEAVDGPIRGLAPSNSSDNDSHLRKRLEEICSQTAEQIRKHLGKVKISELAAKEQ